MKKFLSVFFLFSVLLFFVACSASPYAFKKTVGEIECVEIVFAENSFDYTVIKKLSETEMIDFMEQFKRIKFSTYYFGDPMSVYGDAVKITYQEGDYELICHHWSAYVKDGESYSVWKNCDEEEFQNILNFFLR